MTDRNTLTVGWWPEASLSYWQGASTRQCFVALSGLTAVLLLAQAFVLFPLALADPLLADLPDAVSLHQTYWLLRALSIGMAPVILALRVVAISLLLQGVLAIWGERAKWHAVFRGVLQAEAIFLLESACATVVLIWHSPDTLSAAEALAFRAGLDLFWQPTSAGLASLLVAANLFAVLWTLHIRNVLRNTASLSPLAITTVTILFGVLLVLLRTIALQL